MGLNLTKTNYDYATFLPSISSVYAKFCSDYYTLRSDGPRKGLQPVGLQHGFDSLDFLNEDKGLFYYKDGLYSAGHAFLNREKSWKDERMIQQRDRKKTWIVGDSGGFQIAKGILKFDWKDFEGDHSNAFRQKILDWLEFTADHSMVLDIPTWAIGRTEGIDSFSTCLKGTMYNNDYFIKHRTGDTKFLNVLQGRSKTEADIWFDTVKDLPFEGWAFAGDNMADFEMILHRIIKMRDGHYFGKNENGDVRNVLHFLGQSRLIVACALTSIQRLLRDQLNDDMLRITFDSASAFISVAHGQIFTRDVYENKRFSYLMEKMYDETSLAHSELPFPWHGTIGDQLKIGDICVKSEKYLDEHPKDGATSWDSYSYILMMAHNLERHIKAIQQANRLFSLPLSQKQPFVPSKLMEFDNIVKQIFTSETPFDVITKHHKLLNNLTGRKKGQGINIIEGELSNLFEFDNSGIKFDEIDYENQDNTVLAKIESTEQQNPH